MKLLRATGNFFKAWGALIVAPSKRRDSTGYGPHWVPNDVE